MPASAAISAQGTLLKIGDGATPEAFTTISEITDLSGPNRSMNVKTFLTHSSPGAAMESIGVSLDNGEVGFEINYVAGSATHIKLLADLNAFTKRNFQMVLPDAGVTTWAFTALVQKFDPSEKPGDTLTAKLTLKLTGQIS